MAFDLDRFRRFCRDDAAEMAAASCGDGKKTITRPCRHVLGEPPTAGDREVLDALAQQHCDDLIALYRQHCLAELFVVDDEAGLELAPPERWSSLTDDMKIWWADYADEIERESSTMLESALVFGKIPAAATWFCLIRAGESAGRVAMFTGPGLELVPVAPSFGAFVDGIPASAVGWIQADVRYRVDGPQDQYYPVRYRASVR